MDYGVLVENRIFDLQLEPIPQECVVPLASMTIRAVKLARGCFGSR